MSRITHGFSTRALRNWRMASITRRSLLSLPLGLLLARPGLGHPAHQDEILPEREALEWLREEELDELRVTLEVDAEQLPGLPLVPVGSGKQVVDRRDARLLGVAGHLDACAVPSHRREELDHHVEPLFLAVHGGDEVQEIESEVRVVAEHLHQLPVPARGNLDDGLAVGFLRLQEVLSELRPEAPDDLS